MVFNLPDTSKPAYTVATPVYEGPLDLLLELIERTELDITRLALAEVTDQFLAYLNNLQERAADEVSGFLVIASRLMQIKSEVLLPRPVVREPGEEDPGEMLVQQLIIYKRYKEIAAELGERELLNKRAYLRLAPPPKVEGKLDLSGVGLRELVDAAISAFEKVEDKAELGTVVTAPKVTIGQKIRHITSTIRKRGKTTFRALLGESRSRIEIVVTFLAMLELVKRFRVSATQTSIFGEIELAPFEAWDDEMDFETEFNE